MPLPNVQRIRFARQWHSQVYSSMVNGGVGMSSVVGMGRTASEFRGMLASFRTIGRRNNFVISHRDGLYFLVDNNATSTPTETVTPVTAMPILHDVGIYSDFIDNDITFGCEFEFASRISFVAMRDLLNGSEKLVHSVKIAQGCHGTDCDSWWIQHDGSVRATSGFSYSMEIASPKLSGVRGLQQIKIFLDLLKTNNLGKVNKSCGGHVHFGTFGNDSSTVTNIFSILKDNENMMDQFTSPLRRGDGARFAHTVQNASFNTLSCEKYYKYSFRNFNRNGSFENRHLEGTLNFDRIATWICVNQAIILKAKEKTFKASSRFNFLAELFAGKNMTNLDSLIGTYNSQCKA